MNAVFEIPLEFRTLVLTPALSDEEFETLCASSDTVQFERSRDGEIRMNPPTGMFTSHGNVEVIYQLRAWWKQHRRGIVFDSNGGFFLADGSMLSPDAAYIRGERLKGKSKIEGSRFARMCPDFVIELLSASDSLKATQEKMGLWMANGAELGWLIDPYAKRVWVYRTGEAAVALEGDFAEGSGPEEGFRLDLAEIWNCYQW